MFCQAYKLRAKSWEQENQEAKEWEKDKRVRSTGVQENCKKVTSTGVQENCKNNKNRRYEM